MFKAAVETRLDDPRRGLSYLIKYKSGESQELFKHYLYLPASEGYKEAIRMMNDRYENTLKNLRRFFNFLIKCRSLVSNKQTCSLVNNPDVVFMLVAKHPVYMQVR